MISVQTFSAMKDSRTLQIALISILWASIFFVWQGHSGLDLWDEGFLWYGAQRTMQGEVPFRDFFSYDPGRYYWSAAIMFALQDNGIVALRAAAALIQAGGLFLALQALDRTAPRNGPLFLLLAATSVVIWMFPRHKYFDISAALALIGVLTWLAERPDIRRYFLAGLTVGLVAVIGRNHGVYGLAGSLFVLGYLRLCGDGSGLFRSGTALAAGVAVGYLPIPILMLVEPGFASAFWQSILFQIDSRLTTLPVSVPWPWTVSFGRHTLIGLVFLGVFAWGATGMIWALWRRYRGAPVPPLLLAGAALALPYAHAVSMRADMAHLAQGVYPALLAALGWAALQPARRKWVLTALICVVSIVIMLRQQPGWACRPNKGCIEIEVAGDLLALPPPVAMDIALLRKLVETYAPAPRTFIAAPYWPGAYAVFERRAPMWEVFALPPRDEAFQREEIARIEAADPGFAIIYDLQLDGRDELRYGRTHALITDYIDRNYELQPGYSEHPAYRIYAPKRNGR